MHVVVSGVLLAEGTPSTSTSTNCRISYLTLNYAPVPFKQYDFDKCGFCDYVKWPITKLQQSLAVCLSLRRLRIEDICKCIEDGDSDSAFVQRLIVMSYMAIITMSIGVPKQVQFSRWNLDEFRRL